MAADQDEIVSLVCEDPGEATNLQLTCQSLLAKNQFVDVTLSCVDGQVQAHRLVLCAVSGYLYDLFTSNPTMNPCTHPMVILRDCKVAEVQLALQYVYGGRITVSRTTLAPLLNAARELGCESLEYAVAEALQPTPNRSSTKSASKGRPILRNATTSANPADQSGSSIGGGVSKSLLSQITKAINVKTEQDDDVQRSYDEDEEEHSRKRSRSPSPNSSRLTVPPMPKLLRMTPSPATSPGAASTEITLNRSGHSRMYHDAGPYSPPTLTRMSGSEESLDRNRLQLQHDKAESFVYTNENLDMMFGDEDDEALELNDNDTELLEGSCEVQIKTEPVDDPLLEVKPSVCPWCNQLFDGALQLQRHIKSNHTNTSSKRPYPCPLCSHEFARSAHLKRHIRCLHTSEKPYKCPSCPKEFSRQDKMKIHINRHLQGNINLNTTNGNNESVRTCYPPVAVSQNCGGQVPIKILIPKNNTSAATASGSSTVSSEASYNSTQFQPSSISPSSFFTDPSTSITINALPPKRTPPNRQSKGPTVHLHPVVN